MEIDIFKFKLYFQFFFDKKDMNKNNKFKKINKINYNT